MNDLPQLTMIKADLSNLPPVTLPEGYTICCYTEGDGDAWEQIIEMSFKSKFNFKKDILDHKYFLPERIHFVNHGGIPVATATAWQWEDQPETGYLHMVGANPEYKGLGLGFWVSLAAMHRMKNEGRQISMLHTDDFRLPAIKTYLKLGFLPKMTHESHEQRWADIMKQLQ